MDDRPVWLYGSEAPKRATRTPSVYVPEGLRLRWQAAEEALVARGGRGINPSRLFQEALTDALDALDAEERALEDTERIR